MDCFGKGLGVSGSGMEYNFNSGHEEGGFELLTP